MERSEIHKEIGTCNWEIDQAEQRLINAKEELRYYKEKRDSLYEELQSLPPEDDSEFTLF